MWAALIDVIPEGTPVGWALGAMAGAVLVTGIAKSGFGGGVGILAVPLVAVALDAAVAVGVLLPILIAADVVAVAQHRRNWSGFHLRWSLVGGVVGIAAGTGLLWWFRASGASGASGGGDAEESLKTLLNLTVGGVCVALVGLQVFRMRRAGVSERDDTQRSRVVLGKSPGAGVGAGGLAGFVSTLAHAAGPVMTVYILEQGLDKRRVVGTLVMYFFVVNLLKLPTYVGFGLITWETLRASAVLILLVPVGSWLGLWLNRVIAERPFTLVMYAGAGGAGVWLLVKGLG
ncbi:MAG: sulfite exporter TauE/SafE family protein [Planctomycetota bacterium]